MIASHYAEPVERIVACERRASRRAVATTPNRLRRLEPGEPFTMLDDSLGWAWGYAGNDRRVGYVRSDALVPF